MQKGGKLKRCHDEDFNLKVEILGQRANSR